MATFIVHYGEIALKGRNRDFFERQLVVNIRKALAGLPGLVVRRISGRLLAAVASSATAEARRRLADVIGAVSFAEATAAEAAIEGMKRAAWSLAEDREFKSFKIDAQRASKEFPFTSKDINVAVGAHVQEKSGARVDLENPDLTVFIEAVEKSAFLYTEKIYGPGGLPVGVSGKLLCLLSGGIDSPPAAWKMMKRGCRVDFLHFHSHPFTSKASIEKAQDLAKTLDRFQFEHALYLAPFADAQSEIVKKIPESYRMVFYRIVMAHAAEALAVKHGYLGLVTGESVGQVASQTLENLRAIYDGVGLPVYRPLAGDDKEDIVKLARRIGTYDISIRPHEDCCTLFLPTHPETRANAKKVALYLKRLGMPALVRAVLRDIR